MASNELKSPPGFGIVLKYVSRLAIKAKCVHDRRNPIEGVWRSFGKIFTQTKREFQLISATYDCTIYSVFFKFRATFLDSTTRSQARWTLLRKSFTLGNAEFKKNWIHGISFLLMSVSRCYLLGHCDAWCLEQVTLFAFIRSFLSVCNAFFRRIRCDLNLLAREALLRLSKIAIQTF